MARNNVHGFSLPRFNWWWFQNQKPEEWSCNLEGVEKSRSYCRHRQETVMVSSEAAFSFLKTQLPITEQQGWGRSKSWEQVARPEKWGRTMATERSEGRERSIKTLHVRSRSMLSGWFVVTLKLTQSAQWHIREPGICGGGGGGFSLYFSRLKLSYLPLAFHSFSK